MLSFDTIKSYLLSLILFLIIVSYSTCQSSLRESDLKTENRVLELENKLLRLQKDIDSINAINKSAVGVQEASNSPKEIGKGTVNLKKYLYVLLISEEPSFKTINTQDPPSPILGLPNLIESTIITEYDKLGYASDIYEISNYNEDEKYRKIEEFTSKIKRQWSFTPIFDPEHREHKRRIISVKAKVFDTYSEASISKSQL